MSLQPRGRPASLLSQPGPNPVFFARLAGVMTSTNGDVYFMRLAMQLAQRAADEQEVPVGALVVRDGQVVGEGWNRPIATVDPTAHAEVMAIRAAALQMGNYRLADATLYVTLEPCAMCIGAALNARMTRVVFGAWDAKAGACGSVFDLAREPTLTHRMDVYGGVCSEECRGLLRRFFAAKR